MPFQTQLAIGRKQTQPTISRSHLDGCLVASLIQCNLCAWAFKGCFGDDDLSRIKRQLKGTSASVFRCFGACVKHSNVHLCKEAGGVPRGGPVAERARHGGGRHGTKFENGTRGYYIRCRVLKSGYMSVPYPGAFPRVVNE